VSQIDKAAVGQIKARTSDEFYGRAITATLAVMAAIIIVAFLLTRPATTVVPAGSGASQLTDGFLPGAMAANAAVQARHAQALADGWEARLVGPMATAGSVVRDGWEAGLVGPANSNHEVTDGWEGSLFR
jgi:hypothetical protein